MPQQVISQYPTREEWIDDGGLRLVSVHPENRGCREFGCALHNPTDHEYSHLPLHWDIERAILVRMESDGTAHDDPDEVNFRLRVVRGEASW